LISCRGVGKTFSVLKELIKLSQLPDHCGYTTFLYVSNKTNDNTTTNELINHIALRVQIVGYNQVLSVLHDLIDAKSAYEDFLNKNLQYHVSDETKRFIRNSRSPELDHRDTTHSNTSRRCHTHT
jgi:hypothetical protein